MQFTKDCVPYALHVGGLSFLYRFHIRQEMESILYLFIHIVMRLFCPSKAQAMHDRLAAKARDRELHSYNLRSKPPTENNNTSANPPLISQLGFGLETGDQCHKNFEECVTALELNLAQTEFRKLLCKLMEAWQQLPIAPTERERALLNRYHRIALAEEAALKAENVAETLARMALSERRADLLEQELALVTFQDSKYFEEQSSLANLLAEFADAITAWSDKVPAELDRKEKVRYYSFIDTR